MASPARFERAAFRLGGERSILLSYGDRYEFLKCFGNGRPAIRAGRGQFCQVIDAHVETVLILTKKGGNVKQKCPPKQGVKAWPALIYRQKSIK